MEDNQPRLDEAALAEQADGSIDISIPRDGHPLPEDFDNPPPGQMGHRCVEPKTGVYRRNWSCMKLHKVDGMPQRQFVGAAGKKYYILVGVWVDVPPWVVDVITGSNVDIVKHGYDLSDPLGDGATVQIVDETPRFSYSIIPSA